MFAYLPDSPAKEIPPEDTGRLRLPDNALPDGFRAAGYLMTVRVNNLREEQTLALRLNGLTGALEDYALFYLDAEGKLQEMTGSWTLCRQGGESLEAGASLMQDQIYEIRFPISDGSGLDRSEEAYDGTFAVILVQKQM